ncbi:hypothetical protein FQR65_LT19662 [Abscondita terminalis]|nr:hypothetical protein FQR65_LT19662 [Abscondita terminalis]
MKTGLQNAGCMPPDCDEEAWYYLRSGITFNRRGDIDEDYVSDWDIFWPRNYGLLTYPYDLSGRELRERDFAKWTFGYDHEHSIGLLNKACTVDIQKTLLENWDDSRKCLAFPCRTAKVASSESEGKREVDKCLKILAPPMGEVSGGCGIDIKESNSRDNPFMFLMKKRRSCNED